MPQSAASRPQPQSQTQSSSSPSRKPVDKFRQGSVHVSIWENEGPIGTFRVASFDLRYKDKQEQWQTGHSYAVSDLKHLETAAREARSRIEGWQQSRADHSPSP